MPTTRRSHGTSNRDAIRIVPMHGPAMLAEAAAPAARLTYRHGPLIPKVEVFTIFWGDLWKNAPQDRVIHRAAGVVEHGESLRVTLDEGHACTCSGA